MLVEGTCVDGHEVVCVMQHGRLSVLVRGALRDSCPTCGAKVYPTLESGTVPASVKIASERPVPLDEEDPKQGQG